MSQAGSCLSDMKTQNVAGAHESKEALEGQLEAMAVAGIVVGRG